jgi:hypothetical protein
MYNSEEDMKNYTNAMDSLGKLYPELISGYDASGNAIINLVSAEEKLLNIRKESA